LAVLLIIGGVIGAQIGARIGLLLRAEQLRILLAMIVLAVCCKLGLDLVLPPSNVFSVTAVLAQ
ncbi:MAG TPA: permease, partial [Roseovarius nubinhibens]|nr:permease [Roseovarius nubinhibens]